MAEHQKNLLSHLHDTLFLCFDSKRLMEIAQSFTIDIDHAEKKEDLVDGIVDHVKAHYPKLVSGHTVSISGERINALDCLSFHVNDAIMNFDMIRNNENPASITEFYRDNPIEPDFIVKKRSVRMCDGAKLSVSQGRVYIDGEPVRDCLEAQAIQKAAIAWIASNHPLPHKDSSPEPFI